jgi:hypothetical protein
VTKAIHAASAGLLAALLLAAPAPAASPLSRHNFAASCTTPVSRNDTAATILNRYGAQARRETLPGAEGETFSGVVLYPRDRQRRVEIGFSDDARPRVAFIRIRGNASTWSFGNMALGNSVAQITAANGRGFTLSGFEWDYGGFVTDLKGGVLSQLPGGCRLSIRFALPATATETPGAVMGDVQVPSTHPALRRLRPVVDELSLNWP